MPVTYVNRYRDTYYLHAGKTKTGKPRYWFSTKAEGDLVDAIPEGYEVYENRDAQVYFRKIVPQLVTPAEIAVVKQVFDSSPAILAVSPFAMERQLYSLATHGATS